MLTSLVRDSWWFGPGLAVVFTVTGYVMSMLAARYYRRQSFATFENLEAYLGPYQKDVLAGRWCSFAVLWSAIARGALLLGVRWFLVVAANFPDAWVAVMGGLLLYDVVTHIEHAQRLWFWRATSSLGVVAGHVDYPEWYAIRRRRVELFGFALLFAVCFLFSTNWAFFGAAATCLAFSCGRIRKRPVSKDESGAG